MPRCPICKKPFTVGDDDATEARPPFCSDRCRQIDLGAWLDSAYRIARPLDELDDEALDQGMPGGAGPDDEHVN